MIRFSTKKKESFKAPNVKKYSFIQKNKHLLTLSIVFISKFGFHINHFRNLLLTHYFIFLSFWCVLIFKWYPFGNPIFSVHQSERICISFATLTESYISGRKKPVFSFTPSSFFLFQVLNVNCDTTYCYI